MSQFTLDPIKGLPVLRFCDRLDGFLAGVQAAVAMAKELRMKEAIEAHKPADEGVDHGRTTE